MYIQKTHVHFHPPPRGGYYTLIMQNQTNMQIQSNTNYHAVTNYHANTNYHAVTNYHANTNYHAVTNYHANTNYHAITSFLVTDSCHKFHPFSLWHVRHVNINGINRLVLTNPKVWIVRYAHSKLKNISCLSTTTCLSGSNRTFVVTCRTTTPTNNTVCKV